MFYEFVILHGSSCYIPMFAKCKIFRYFHYNLWCFTVPVRIKLFKGALCHGQNNVPTEYVCYCFDESNDPRCVSFISLTCCLALSEHYLYVTSLNEALKCG